MMIKERFKQVGFVLALAGLCSCSGIGSTSEDTIVPTPYEIPGISSDDWSDSTGGHVSVSEPEPAGYAVGTDREAEPTKLPVRDWEYWEEEGYTKEDILVCDNDMMTLKLLGWDASNNRILFECQNKTGEDISVDCMRNVYVDGFAISTAPETDLYQENYLKKIYENQSFYSDYYLYNYFGVPPMECRYFQESLDLEDLYMVGLSGVGELEFNYEYGYYSGDEEETGEFTFYPDGDAVDDFMPGNCSVVYEDENFRLLCVGKCIGHTEYTGTPYRVVYFLAETLTGAGECYDYAFECTEVIDGKTRYPSDSDYAARPYSKDAPMAGRKELQAVQAWKLEDECESVMVWIGIKVHPEGEPFNYTSTPLDTKYDLRLDDFEDGKLVPVVLKAK